MTSKSKTQTQQQAEQFVEMCRYLGLKQLAEEYPQLLDKVGKDDPGYYEFIRQIILSETAAKKQRRVEYLVKQSRLPQPLKMLSGYDFDFQKKLDRRLVMDLSSMEFIERKESILFLGNNGVGKSHLAQSLALMACQKGYKTLYTTCSELIRDLNQGVFEKPLEKRIRKYINC
jgi:DNA replication protein DnaC